MKQNLNLKIAKEAYSSTPAKKVGDYELVHSTPTLKFYKHGNDIKIGVRGTQVSSPADIKADLAIAAGKLHNSSRYKSDVKAIAEFQKKFPASEYHYSGAGHSLGGAIIDNLLESNLIKQGSSYNPAVQPRHAGVSSAHERHYNKNDPLYHLMGKHLADNPAVHAGPEKTSLERLGGLAGKVSHGLSSHGLEHFQAGGGQMHHNDMQSLIHSPGLLGVFGPSLQRADFAHAAPFQRSSGTGAAAGAFGNVSSASGGAVPSSVPTM